MIKNFLLLYLLIFTTSVNAKYDNVFYELPSNLNETVTVELIDESMLLLRKGNHENWLTTDVGSNGGLMHIHKPTLKFNIETDKVYFWSMMVFWNNLKSEDLRGFFPPIFIEMDCKNSRSRKVATIKSEELQIVTKTISSWSKSQDFESINLCPELQVIKEIEFKKYEEFLNKKRSEGSRKKKIM